jgi:hypothetical protein
MACPHAFIFGTPTKGFHSTRIFGLALFDILGTVGLAVLTTWIFNISLVSSLIGWFVAGELLHYYFGSQTAFLSTIGVTAC